MYAHRQHINVLKHFVYVQCGWGEQFEEAVRLNNDIMPSFWLHKWPRTPKSDPSSVGIPVWGYCHMPLDSISMCSNTLCMSNVDGREAVWGGRQPQPWRNDIILIPQVTQPPKYEPSSVGTTFRGYCHRPLTAYQCSQSLCICLMRMWEAVWVGCQPQPWQNDIILTPKVTQNLKIWAK